MEQEIEWGKLSSDEQKRQLYLKQKRMLDTFIEKHAISKEQYDKSLTDLTKKMGMQNLQSKSTEFTGA